MSLETQLTTGGMVTADHIGSTLATYVGRRFPLARSHKIEYVNLPCAFDIETTSFHEGLEKRACMYEWTFGVNGGVVYGRTWAEFMDLIHTVGEYFHCGPERRLIVYVHNLAFEFQFIRHLFEWKKVFSLDTHKPCYAVTIGGIEFRCSMILSGYSLENLGNELTTYKCAKKVGDLDYSKPRHSGTPLTSEELGYCEMDVRVVMCYIQEQIEQCGSIAKIPLTKTGYVRNLCRQACLYGDGPKRDNRQYSRYHGLMQLLTIEPEEYRQLKRAFQGGFTHANAWRSGKIYEHVESFDFTSSYPAVMVAEQFPMSKAEEITIKDAADFRRQLDLYCCLFDVRITGLEDKLCIDHPLSKSRCFDYGGVIEDNGRVVSADYICTTWTDQDFWVMERFYSWEKIEVFNFRRYRRGYLPTEFVRVILQLYADKTQLKGVAGKEIEYQVSKGMLNSCYGMTVTDILRDEIIYNDQKELDEQWSAETPELEKAIEHYNRSKQRFLFYPWGVWVCAYARRRLFTGILEFGGDYIYSDTDSIKVLNADRHREYIDRYNRSIQTELEWAMDYHGFPRDLFRPRTIEGKEKILGTWDDEGEYTKFKTLGAKRYITEGYNKKGKLEVSITVSGVNKKNAVPWMVDQFGDRVFEEFRDGLTVPAEHTGKLTHTYIERPHSGELVDYLGHPGRYSEYSAVHLEPASYCMSLYSVYYDYLLGIWEESL